MSATPKADLDPNLNAQLTTLQNQAAKLSPAALQGNQTQWMIPNSYSKSQAQDATEWSGDLFDWVGMAIPFDRSQSNQWVVAAVSDANNSGTTGDLVVGSLQVDYLAVMERAFRMRHTMRRPRAFTHAMGRVAGHGNAKGPLVQCVIEFINGLVKESKGGGGGT